MGWLRDLMDQSNSRIGSYGQLAQRALQHKGWPADSRIQTRSLASLFSKFDRNQELDWLRERPAELAVVAELLGRSPEDLWPTVGPARAQEGERFLRLRDLKYGRDIDLFREDLPPGIPDLLLEPREWSPLVWRGLPGAGRGLVRHYLTARRLASTATWSESSTPADVPGRGPLFLDVLPGARLTAQDLLGLRLGQRPVCLALDLGDPAPPLPTSAVEIQSLPLAAYLPELVDWAAARVGPESHLEADKALHWFRRVILPVGGALSFGEALGILGMLDEIPPRSLSTKGWREAVLHFVERRLRAATERGRFGPRAVQDTLRALRAIAAQVLVDSSEPLSAPRTREAWLALLSVGLPEPAPDAAWLNRALLPAGLSRRDLERLQAELPPSEHQALRALEAAGFLASPEESTQEGGGLVLRPRFLLRLLDAGAVDEALALSPSEWGKLALDDCTGPRSRRLIAELISRLEVGHCIAHDAALDDFDEESLELTAALEASTESLGYALLAGAELPDALATDTLRAIGPTLIATGDFPTPKVRALPAWGIALLALSEHHAGLPPHADPWSPTFSGRAQLALCWLEAGITELPVAAQTEAWRLLARYLRHHGDQGTPAQPILAFLAAESPAAQAAALLTCAGDDEGARLLETLAHLRAPEAPFEAAFWRSLAHAEGRQAAQLERLLEDRPGLSEQLWRQLPDELGAAWHDAGRPVRWDLLLPHQFDGIAARIRKQVHADAAHHMPLTLALHRLARLGSAAFSPSALVVLLRRFPVPLGRACLRRFLDLEESGALAAIEEARVFGLLQDELPSMAELLRRPPSVLSQLQRALLANLRDPESPTASRRMSHELYTKLERALRPLMQASTA